MHRGLIPAQGIPAANVSCRRRRWRRRRRRRWRRQYDRSSHRATCAPARGARALLGCWAFRAVEERAGKCWGRGAAPRSAARGWAGPRPQEPAAPSGAGKVASASNAGAGGPVTTATTVGACRPVGKARVRWRLPEVVAAWVLTLPPSSLLPSAIFAPSPSNCAAAAAAAAAVAVTTRPPKQQRFPCHAGVQAGFGFPLRRRGPRGVPY